MTGRADSVNAFRRGCACGVAIAMTRALAL